jgi:glycosyltransferase involved in cell wall biosynthesis
MILLDAQQYGVVPISFDSYASVTDIIEDGKNGLIVPNNNIKKYAEQLMFLMSHRDEREMMAKNGLISCQVFSTDKIVDKWEEVIKNDDYKN